MSTVKKVLTSVADVETAMNNLQKIKAQLDIETADANQKIAHIREGVNSSVSSLEEQAKRLNASIELWAETMRDDDELFPKGKKSLELQAGTISFRLGAPKVVLRNKVKLADVVARAIEKGFKKLLSTPEPVLDKTAVKDQYDEGKLSEADLKALGLEITQDETVSIKLNTLESYK